MPTYEYVCRQCGDHLEVVQSFTDDALTECPNCGGVLKKVFGNIGIVFKGSGFYKTDSRSSSSSGKAKTEAGASTTSEKSSAEGGAKGDSESGSKGRRQLEERRPEEGRRLEREHVGLGEARTARLFRFDGRLPPSAEQPQEQPEVDGTIRAPPRPWVVEVVTDRPSPGEASRETRPGWRNRPSPRRPLRWPRARGHPSRRRRTDRGASLTPPPLRSDAPSRVFAFRTSTTSISPSAGQFLEHRRVQPVPQRVEGVRHVDDPSLGADLLGDLPGRARRRGEALGEEQADQLALRTSSAPDL